ncbi:MAG: substrate-binding domain-containing protein [Acidimicrobiales bacterium]
MRIGKRSGTFAISLALIFGVVAAACGSSPSSAGSGKSSAVSATGFTTDFSAMRALRPLAKDGTGKIAAILPDTSRSTPFGQLDAPDITRAVRAAGLPASADIAVQGAQDLDSIQLSDAETDIANGATVLLLDPLDSGIGTSIERYAKSRHVDVVDYDQLTLGGAREYYVGFNNIQAGKLMGQGLVSCAASWHVSKPQVIVMRGPLTDDNAELAYQGYFDDVLTTYFSSGRYTDAANTAPTGDPSTALAEFQVAYVSHLGVDAVVAADDETAAPIIDYLRSHGVKPKTFPITGEDATLGGLQNVLSGFQCGTVYKPAYVEAQAAVALAVYLRDGRTPPPSLVNGETTDAQTDTPVASVLVNPEWVTTSNIEDTVVKDGVVPVAQLCAAPYTLACVAAGITVTG